MGGFWLKKSRWLPLAIVGLLGLSVWGCATVGPGQEVGGRIYVANQESDTISVIDPSTLKVVATIPSQGSGTHDLALTPDGRLLFATNLKTGTLTVVDTATNRVRATLQTGKATHAIAISPDGKEVWVNAGGEDHIPILDVGTLKVKDKVDLGIEIGNGHIWFSPDGKQAYVTSPKFGRVYIIDTATRKVVANIPVGKSPTFIQVTSDGKHVWGTNTGGTEVYVIDTSATAVAATVEVGPNPNHLTILGRSVYVTVGGANEVAVIENVGGNLTVTRRIPVGKKPHGIWPSLDGKRVYVVHEESHDMTVIDLSTRLIVGTVPVGKRPIAVVVARR